MLVLLGPPFSGNEEEFARLSAATGLLVYELKTKLKAGAWGVVKALGDPGQAEELAQVLRGTGFRVAVVDSAVVSDPARMFAPLRALELRQDELILHLKERSMPIPYRALLTVVRGEVQVGSRPRRSSSSTSLAAAVQSSADEVFRESASTQLDAFAAADIHFATVLWAARIDARQFDFSGLGGGTGTAQDLDRLVDLLAERTGLRVDRASKISSVASFTTGGPIRSPTPMPVHGAPQRREIPERFDAYSRLIAEAERQAARQMRVSTRPPPPG